MTREEATIQALRYHIEALEETIKTLAQESCEDAISRQEVLDQTYLWSKDEFLRVTNPFDYLRKRINSLLPVTPQPKTECSCEQIKWERDTAIAQLKELGYGLGEKPKTGHWIMSNDGLYRPICNNCGAHPWKGYIPTVEEAKEVFKYCPQCGAKMVEPQESEDKKCTKKI